jgi:hypothetical protein
LGISVFLVGIELLKRFRKSASAGDRTTGDGSQEKPPVRWRGRLRLSSPVARILRITGAACVVGVLALLIAGVGLYFLMRAEAIENSALSRRIEASVQKLIGPAFILDMHRTEVGFDPEGLLSLVSREVRVSRRSDNRVFSDIGQIVVGIRPLSLLFGEPKVDAVIIDNASFDTAALVAPFTAGNVHDINSLFEAIAGNMASLHGKFNDRRFRLFRFRNVRVTGIPLGGRTRHTVNVEYFDLRRKGRRALELDAEINTALSGIKLAGAYQRSRETGDSLHLQLDGLNAGEWAWSPDGEEGPVGSNAVIRVDAMLPLNAESVEQPKVVIRAGESTLRLGRTGRTELKELVLNFELDRQANRIALDASPLRAGRFKATLSGSMAPTSAADGFGGDWRYQLAADPALPEPTLPGEPAAAGAIRLAGVYESAARILRIDEAEGVIGDDSIAGQARFGFHGRTPSLWASVASDGLDVAAVKQFWPFFLGPPARQWVQRNASGGRVSAITVEADIPPNVVGRFRQGAKMQQDEFTLRANFAGARINTFGEVPPILDASGRISMDGMRLSVVADEARAEIESLEPVTIADATFTISDIGIRPNPAEIHLPLAGSVPALATIADRPPLRVFGRLGIDPGKASGRALADVAAKFRLKRGLTENEVEWHAIVDLEAAASSQKIFARAIADADLHIDANRELVRITGLARVDGNMTRLELTEPLGESKTPSARNFQASLDNEARRKMGLSLEPVIDGPIDVSVEQIDADTQAQTIDLGKAQLALPWIGWSKGKGIPAVASFRMTRTDSITELDDFYIEGEGFSAAGTLKFDNKGILSADFADISLNERDSFSLQLKRSNSTFDITVTGARMDARSLLNKLFHQEGFGTEQGSANVRLSATLGEVTGFNGKTIRNVSMTFGMRDGWLDNLSLRGVFSKEFYVNIFASRSGGRTTFEIDSTDAGSTLAFASIYQRMNGGVLRAQLIREGDGPFIGPVRATTFTITDEPRLKSIVSNTNYTHLERGQTISQFRESLSEVDTRTVRFLEAKAFIEKGEGHFSVRDGVLTGAQVGFTFDGLVYDAENHMDLSGTFLPAMGISRAIGFIPLVGELLGNGRDSGLIGITFRMRGPSRNPRLDINPISVVAPGIFRKVFEYRN